MKTVLECVELETSPQPTASVIWLHGLGADGHDFVPVVHELQALGAPAARYVFPHAPTMPVTINGGALMRAWYDIVNVDLMRREDEKGIRASQILVDALIAREAERGISHSRIVLAGFSQGGAIALQAGLRQPKPLACIIALSCYLPLANTLDAERHNASATLAVFMGHGSYDPIVPLARGIASRDALQSAGYAVEWHQYPMPHSVNEQEIRDITAFLKRVIG
ncbi:MAG: alpha/beta fold hydrolase [Burkholderiaceae bacterium]